MAISVVPPPMSRSCWRPVLEGRRRRARRPWAEDVITSGAGVRVGSLTAVLDLGDAARDGRRRRGHTTWNCVHLLDEVAEHLLGDSKSAMTRPSSGGWRDVPGVRRALLASSPTARTFGSGVRHRDARFAQHNAPVLHIDEVLACPGGCQSLEKSPSSWLTICAVARLKEYKRPPGNVKSKLVGPAILSARVRKKPGRAVREKCRRPKAGKSIRHSLPMRKPARPTGSGGLLSVALLAAGISVESRWMHRSVARLNVWLSRAACAALKRRPVFA